MVTLTSLWLPILLAGVFVYVASSLIHMVVKWHNKTDYQPLPGESNLMKALAEAGVKAGTYAFPNPADGTWGSQELKDKYPNGPYGFMTVLGHPGMGSSLVLWFVYVLLVSLFVAYLLSRTLTGPEPVEYMTVFRLAGTTSFMAYGIANLVPSIWMGRPWGSSFLHTIDGLIYALLTAGVFGWLWPR